VKKKSRIRTCSFILMGSLLILTFACKRKDVPTLTTSDVSSIKYSSAVCGGNIKSEEGSAITEKGVCWGTSEQTIEDNITSDGAGSGNFTSTITGLAPNVTYYVMAYATNDIGTGYGDVKTFTTPYDTAFTVPCSPPQNSIVYNYITMSYSVYAGSGGLVYGNWGLRGSGSSSDLRIEFIQEPGPGRYITIGATGFIGPQECVVNGTFGSPLGYHYIAAGGDTVYVVKNGPGLYSMTFCDLHFSSGSTSYTFDSDGNLTSD
jgi:hypothetical protein